MADREQERLIAYYKELYEKSEKKNQELTEELVAAEEKCADLQRKVDMVKKSLMFRILKPFRLVWAHTKNMIVRVKRYGSLRNLIQKLKSKRIERQAYKLHGTLSFPDEEQRKMESGFAFKKDVTFSILVPLFNTPESFLRELFDCVLAQTRGEWELCLADGSDAAHDYVGKIVEEYSAKDKASTGLDRFHYQKIENKGISENTNVCFTMVTGNYVALLDHDDLLHPSVLFEYRKVIDETDADFIYCDEATFKGDSIDHMITLHFKPDFSPDNLRANNYICHFSAFKVSLLEETGLFRGEFDGSQDHDMILRLTAAAKTICHVPKILYYWRSHAASVASDINAKTYAIDAAKNAVAAHLKAQGFENFKIESTRAFATIFRIRYEITGKPKLSIIIANKDHEEDLRRCVESIMIKSSYENYEIIIVENNSTEQGIFDYYKELEMCPAVKVVTYKGEFNYSAINNLGAQNAEGEYLVLLNNDTEVITRNWMEELLMYAQRKDVGAVGCKLYYDDYTIQHAGIVLGLGAHRTAGHTHYKQAKDNLGYMGRLCYAQDVSAVTGACLMVKKTDFFLAGGLSEEFAVALNDVDFCLKLRSQGLLNIFTPFAELFHYESKSRGGDLVEESRKNAERYDGEAERFKEKWKAVLSEGDPYYNVNFSLDHSNYTLKGQPKSMI